MKNILLIKMLAASVVFLLTAGNYAQSQSETEEVKPLVVDAQAETVQIAGSLSAIHVTSATVPGANERAHRLNQMGARSAELLAQDPALAETPTDEVQPELSTPTGNYFYIGKVTAPATPSVMKTAVIHNIYVNMKTGTIATNWGNPSGFLTDLTKSAFIHLTDQYTGSTTNNRYTVDATAHQVTYTFASRPIDADIENIVHAVAKSLKMTGLGHLYNVFLMPGVDVCITTDPSIGCYSPDQPWYFTFCAYHTAVSFPDIGTVLYTVEPFQNVEGCAVSSPSVNGVLIDSTNNMLSNETFEAITDANPTYGYTNKTDGVLIGHEIGDECKQSSGVYITPAKVTLNGHSYRAQLEYSNTYAACAQVP